jgi:putative DNA primase/helicase
MTSDPFAPIAGGAAKPRAEPSDWRLETPVPPDAPPAPERHPKLGKPSARWEYRDAAGELLGFACRFDASDGKQFRPLALYAPKAGGPAQWRWEAWPAPRPLYGLDKLAARPAAPVLLCEGEKAADAAARLLPDYVAMTSPNGSRSAGKADWRALAARRVVIWPDADAPGDAYARAAAAAILAAGAASVAIIAPPAGVAEGFDAADAESDGWDTARAAALVASAAPFIAPTQGRAGKDKAAPRRARVPQRDSLMALAADAILWRGPDYEAYATIPIGSHRENWPIRSQMFGRWLASRAYEASGAAPGAQALEDARRVLEARAVSEGREQAPWRRIGAREGKLFIDLADREWRAVEIDPAGFRVVKGDGLPFVRSPRMRPLCAPERGGAIDELRPFVNVESDADFFLVVAWLVGAFRERGPYPILVLNGQQGTGKSFLSRLLRSLVDPTSPAIQGPPKDDAALIVNAQNCHLLTLDNLSFVDAAISDALCRLATGSGFAVRKLHTDSEENIFDGARPIMVNGIPTLAERADLAERAITIKLSPIGDDARRTESDIEEAWAKARPRVFGALCAALSAALANIDATRLARAPRMADFARWIVAAEPGLGWDAGTFEAAYAVNRQESVELAFESNLVAVAVRDLVEKLEGDGRQGWEGTATELLASLDKLVSEKIRNVKEWPRKPATLGNALERVAPMLFLKKIYLEKKKSGNRIVSLRWDSQTIRAMRNAESAAPSYAPAGEQWEAASDDGF